jgi:heme/copper-type cytochrome/quinol oxidase subunit 3
MLWEFTQLPFDWKINAFASLFYTLGGFALLLLIIALGMNLFVQVWAWQGHYTELDHTAVQNSAWFLYAIVIYWLILYGVIYLAP